MRERCISRLASGGRRPGLGVRGTSLSEGRATGGQYLPTRDFRPLWSL